MIRLFALTRLIEENFAFSYNIISLPGVMRKAPNRERTNVGRTAYRDRVKQMLLGLTLFRRTTSKWAACKADRSMRSCRTVDGGSVLYLRGPAMSWWATERFETGSSISTWISLHHSRHVPLTDAHAFYVRTNTSSRV